MIFPNYLYKKIIYYIIYYKYQIQELYSFNSIIYYNQFYSTHNNEILQLSIISKQFFNIISDLLYDTLNAYNYIYLNHFINKNKNNKYNNKLIKNKKIKILGVTDSKLEEEKTIINLNLNNKFDTSYFKKSYNKFPSNYEFDVQLEFNYHGETTNLDTIEFNNQVGHLQLTGMKNNENQSGKQFEKIIKFKPKSISYNPNSDVKLFYMAHVDYTTLFQMESVEHLNLEGNDHVEPLAISKINNDKTRLKSLSVILLLHDMIRYLNDNSFPGFVYNNCCRNLCGLKSSGTIKEDLNEMVTTLSNNKSIKKLVLKNFCTSEECIVNQDTSKLNQYFKLLFERNSSIESLTLVNFDFIDSIIYSGLELNRSIISLELLNYVSKPYIKYQDNLKYLFNNYLSSNKVVKNLKFDWFNSLNNLIDTLISYKNNLNNLYSLSIIIRYFNNDNNNSSSSNSNNNNNNNCNNNNNNIDSIQINNFINQILSISLNIIEINISIFSNNNQVFKKILNNNIQSNR